MRPALLILAFATAAAADTPSQQADALFKKGKQLMADDHYVEACAAFDRSYEIEVSLATLLNRADCREKNDQLATAWKLFNEAEQRTRAMTDTPSKQMNSTARTRVAKLAARLSKLTIKVGERPESFTLELDGKQIDRTGWTDEPIDGGTYVLRAHARGMHEWTQKIVVDTGEDRQTIVVPQLEPDRPQVPVKPVEPVKQVDPPALLPSPSPAPPVETPHRSHTGAFAFGGIAIGLGVGAVLALRWGNSAALEAKEPGTAMGRRVYLNHLADNRHLLAAGCGSLALVSAGMSLFFAVRKPKQQVAVIPGSRSAMVVLARSW